MCSPNKNIYRIPDYNKIEELISTKPDIIGNCNLFIINAIPMLYELQYAIMELNSGEQIERVPPYDFDAIQFLKPKSIISLYEVNKGY